jgi:spore coat protein CotH
LALAALLFGLALLPATAAPTPTLPHPWGEGREGGKAADESDKLFRSGEVLRLAIELGPNELNALRREPRKYVRATLKEGDKVVGREVGVHLKGAAGSFRGIDDKPSLTLNMDKFVKGQRFHGMDKFHLANSLQDPSYVSELICGELFRSAGVPASRVSHAIVTINGRRRGLYYLKEGYDRFFRKRHFGDSSGNLYDGGFLRELDQPLQRLAGKGDVKDHADLKALVAAARERDPRRRFERMEKLLDLDKFVSFLVLEVVTWDWDGYPMNRNNYRVYHEPKRDKITFIPSGMDQMFGNPTGPILPNFQGLIARALLQTPQGRERYLARFREIMTTVYRPDALRKRLDELQARVQPALAAVNPGAAIGYPNQVNRLRQAIAQRARSVEEQLKRIKK